LPEIIRKKFQEEFNDIGKILSRIQADFKKNSNGIQVEFNDIGKILSKGSSRIREDFK